MMKEENEQKFRVSSIYFIVHTLSQYSIEIHVLNVSLCIGRSKETTAFKDVRTVSVPLYGCTIWDIS